MYSHATKQAPFTDCCRINILSTSACKTNVTVVRWEVLPTECLCIVASYSRAWQGLQYVCGWQMHRRFDLGCWHPLIQHPVDTSLYPESRVVFFHLSWFGAFELTAAVNNGLINMPLLCPPDSFGTPGKKKEGESEEDQQKVSVYPFWTCLFHCHAFCPLLTTLTHKLQYVPFTELLIQLIWAE